MRTQFFWFYFGAFLLALTLGILTGISASPVVAVIIPLVFSILTAGGAIYVIRGGAAETPSNSIDQRMRAGFLGKQLTVFALGFIVGLWTGVAGKFHAPSIWFIKTTESPSYSVMKINNMLLLSAAIDLDNRMTQAGVTYGDRLELFKEIAKGIDSRSQNGDLAKSDLEAAKAIIAKDSDVPKEPTKLFSGEFPPVAIHEAPPRSIDALRKELRDG